MLRLIIIDDESATRNGLLKHMDWERLEIGMVQTAGSGQEALAVCEQFHPDLILSDIRMRGMDGVETCRILHSRFPEARIIFLSGYSDKEYLKAAIELGAVNYVEKPVHFGELERAVRKAVGEIKQSKSNQTAARQSVEYLRRKVFFALLEPPADLLEYLQDDMDRSGLFVSSPALLRVAVLRTASPVTNLSRFLGELDRALAARGGGQSTLYREFRDNRRLLLLLGGEADAVADESPSLQAYSAAVKRGIDSQPCFLALGEPVQRPLELDRSYRAARQAEGAVFSLGYGGTGFPGWGADPVEFDTSLYDSFAKALSSGSEESIAACLDQISVTLRENRAVLGPSVRNILFTLDHEISLQFRHLFPESQNKPALVESDFGKLEAVDTVEGLRDCLLGRARALLQARSREESNNSAVAQVIRIIQQRYGDRTVSVRQLADEVYLTPTYLSALFKRKTGKTIGEFLTGVRMERARELLKDNRLKLYHVAEQVGYEDPNYFAKIFKKQMGMTPSEFRDKMW